MNDEQPFPHPIRDLKINKKQSCYIAFGGPFTCPFFKTQCHVIDEVMQIAFILIRFFFSFFFDLFLFFLTLFPFSCFFSFAPPSGLYFFYSFLSASLLHFTAETTHSIMNYNQSNDFWLFKGI